jgi:hypothetical protein
VHEHMHPGWESDSQYEVTGPSVACVHVHEHKHPSSAPDSQYEVMGLRVACECGVQARLPIPKMTRWVRAWKVRMCMRMHASRPCASQARTESLAAALLAGAAPLLTEAPCRPERYALVRRAYTAVGAGEPTQRAPPSRRGRWDHGARVRVNVCCQEAEPAAMAFGGGQSELPSGALLGQNIARCMLRTVDESISSGGSDDGADATRDACRVGPCDDSSRTGSGSQTLKPIGEGKLVVRVSPGRPVCEWTHTRAQTVRGSRSEGRQLRQAVLVWGVSWSAAQRTRSRRVSEW